jgi:integrase
MTELTISDDSSIVGEAPAEEWAGPTLSLAEDVDEFLLLPPLERLQRLIAADNFPDYLRQEPIQFDQHDPIYGYACSIKECAGQRQRAGRYCQRHEKERVAARKAGTSEVDWAAQAQPIPPSGNRTAIPRVPASCVICPDRDATSDSNPYCCAHSNGLAKRRGASSRQGREFDEAAWLARQTALPGLGPCAVADCGYRVATERTHGLCRLHWKNFRSFLNHAQRQDATAKAAEIQKHWLRLQVVRGGIGRVSLAGLAPQAEAEIRYALHAHTLGDAPSLWFPGWLRTLVAQMVEGGIESILDIDADDDGWVPQAQHINRIIKAMRTDIEPVVVTRAETRALGYIDPLHWGMRFPGRRSRFDLLAIRQGWLRDLAWDYLADLFDSPNCPRSAGAIETIRRALISLSAYLATYAASEGDDAAELSETDAQGWAADYRRRVRNEEPQPGIFLADGTQPAATELTRTQYFNAVRKVMRWTLEFTDFQERGLRREFLAAFPAGGGYTSRPGRPIDDVVYRKLIDPENLLLLASKDPRDSGVADIWFIQARVGRRIGEVVNLRWDCVSENLGRTFAYFDMTKVGKLDYAVQIPIGVYEVIKERQTKTAERFRLRFGRQMTASERRSVALFPTTVKNPNLERAISTEKFSSAFNQWISELDLGRVVPHQARHTLATRLVEAGAPMVAVKQVLGHVSERMSEHYVTLAGDFVEPYLQQVWVRGAGSAEPGELVLQPSDLDASFVQRKLIDLAALPTEHGLCVYKPVVGGADCPFGRKCHDCEHFVLTGADYSYWKRQQERWTTWAEGAPNDATRDYIYGIFDKSSKAIEGLEKALATLGLLEEAMEVDLRNPYQDFFEPIWNQGFIAKDLIAIADGTLTGELADDGNDS